MSETTKDADRAEIAAESGPEETGGNAPAEAAVEEGAASSTETEETGGRARQLEAEGEIAADYLEALLDIADLDGDIDVDVDGDRAAVAIVDSEDGRVPRRLVRSTATTSSSSALRPTAPVAARW